MAGLDAMMDDRSAGDRVRHGWAFFQSQRPLAAWACWQGVLRQNPENKAATEALASLAEALDLPDVARKPLRFLPPEGEARRLRWNGVFQQSAADFGPGFQADPTAAAVLFRGLWDDDPADASAAWNLAICLAWAGSNRAAVDALETYLNLTAAHQPHQAADAWTLAELLRHGAGAEELADCVTLSVILEMVTIGNDPDDFMASFGHLARYRELAGQAVGVIAADLLERPLRSGPAAEPILASAVASGGKVKLSAPASAESGVFFRDLTQLLGWFTQTNMRVDQTVLPIAMLDAAIVRFRLPDSLPAPRRDQLTRAAVADFLESQWIHQPRHSLAGQTALAASQQADPAMKARLEGLVQFAEQLARRPGSRPIYQDYDFDRLRYRLGLTVRPGKDDAKGETRHKALLWYNLPFVQSVPPESIGPENLRTAWETATACTDDALAIRLGEIIQSRHQALFEQVSIARWVAPFLRRDLRENALDQALKRLDEAIGFDQAHRSGHDQAKLLLWRAQAMSRLGSPQDAQNAWSEACAAADALPIWQFDAVTDLAETDPAVGVSHAGQAPGTGFVGSLLRQYLAELAADES